jgi:hypothetical protein
MEGVGLIAAAQRRARRRTLVLVAVLVAIVGGLSMALVAGALRSDSVVDRFYARQVVPDASVYDGASVLTRDDIAALPGVERTAVFSFIAFLAKKPDGSPARFVNGAAIDFATRDGTTRLLAGAVPRAGHPRDVVVNHAFVDQFHRSVGDVVALSTFAPDQGEEVQNGTYNPRGPIYRFHITGIVRVPQDIGIDEVRSIGSAADEGNLIGVQNSFYETHRHEFLDFGAEYMVNLAHPRSGARALGDALASTTPEGADAPLVLPVEDDSHRGALETPVRVETTALLALGIGVALAGAIPGVGAADRAARPRRRQSGTPVARSHGAAARDRGGGADPPGRDRGRGRRGRPRDCALTAVPHRHRA